jgi:excisionase family DNA binding protein
VPEALLDELAVRVADHLAERLEALHPPEPYLTVEEAAAHLACPASRIYDLTAAKRLRHFRDGRRLLLRREDLDACLSVVEAKP